MIKKKNLAIFFLSCLLAAGGLVSVPDLALTAQPGLDLVQDGLGVATRTDNAVNPFTAIQHWVEVVDYDGIADNGSSHTVTVAYPNSGPTHTLNFYEKRSAHSAIYEFWDDTVPQPVDPGTYNGTYIYRVDDSSGEWSEATDDLQVDTLAPVDERTFLPKFSTPRSMIAHFDNVFKNGALYDDFENGFDPDNWEWQPQEVVSNETQMVVPNAITVDGDPSDWAGLIPALVDAEGDSSGGPDADIKYVYTAMDDTYAYVMVETYNQPINPDATVEINFNYKPWQHHTHGPHTDLHTNSSNSNLSAWNDDDLDGDMTPFPISGYTVVRDDVVEARIPLSQIENAAYFNPTFVNIWTDSAPDHGDDPSDVKAAISGEVHFERTWFPESQSIWMRMTDPETVNELKATVRVESISSNDDWIWARLGGKFCRNDDGEVFARVAIKGNDTYIWVYSEYWDEGHSLEKHLLPQTSLGPVTQGNRYELTLEWYEPGRTFTFRIEGLDDNVDYSDSYTIPGPIYTVDNPYRAIGISSWIFLDTTPTFDWQPVPDANHYRVRLYNWDTDEQFFQGYTKSPPYELPPGILKPDGIYKLQIYALKDHQWFEWDNVSRNTWDSTRFITRSVEAQDPFINLRSLGVYTWNAQPPIGPITLFNVSVHDAQGVPDNIESVEVTIPGGQKINLYIDEYITANEGRYKGVYFGGTPSGTYSFVATDRDDHTSAPVTETLDPQIVDYEDAASLTPTPNTLIGDTEVGFNWGAVSGATNYWLAVYDKDYNRLFSVHTEETDFFLPPGVLNENSLYRFRVENYGEFREDNLDNGSTSPDKGVWNANMFTTTASAGTATPGLNLDRFGVAVWHAPHPVTGASLYWLDLMAMVTDDDGVPENIQKVEVIYPDNTTIRALKYDNSPAWGMNYYDSETYEEDADIQTGVYTFLVTDFGGNTIERQDTLTNVTTNILPWPTNVAPADKATVHTTTPTITWDPVGGAAYYKVRIMSAYRHPTVHWSEELTDTFYTIPGDTLENGATHGYKVYAYREASGTEVDFYSSNRSWHQTNNHFTIRVSGTGPVIDSFNANTTSGPAPLTVQFTCQASDPGGGIAAYHWDYDGNGSIDETSTSGPVTHVYAAPGSYPAIVTVEDTDGNRATSNPIVIDVSTSTGGCPTGYLSRPTYEEDCQDRPAGSVCIAYDDDYIWLVYSPITGWGTDGNVQIAYTNSIEYRHVIDSSCVQLVGADSDNDIVPDLYDNCPAAANPLQEDSDEDSIGDVCDPGDDTDGDGVNDDIDNCPAASNADQADFDGDLIGDVCDSDDDNDFVSDLTDNCPLVNNPFQADFDGDSMGNVCDSDADGDGCVFWEYYDAAVDSCWDCEDLNPAVTGGECLGGAEEPKKDKKPADSDNDGVADTTDNCPSVANDGQDDSDDDNIGDACDSCPNDPENDTDNDGLCADVDSCPNAHNPPTTWTDINGNIHNNEQPDFDGDGSGDACDADADDDGAVSAEDCNDLDPGVNPDASEVSDGIDNNCDGLIDEGLSAYHIEFNMAGYDSWLPKAGQSVQMVVSVKDSATDETVAADAPGVSFTVSDVSNHPGAYTNHPDSDNGADLQITNVNENADGTYTLTVACADYGGSISIHAQGSVTVNGLLYIAQGDLKLPKDIDNDGVADAWEQQLYGTLSTLSSESADYDGDGLTVLEEFRGFKWGPALEATSPAINNAYGAYGTTAYEPKNSAVHFRTDPGNYQDLFIKVTGYDFNAGNADNGYSAECDCPFALGAAFADAGVAVHAVSLDNPPGFTNTDVPAGDACNGDIACWELNIDTVKITNNNTSPYGTSDGHINKRGLRDWSWDIKGFSLIGSQSSYGSGTTTYQIPLDNYFADHPYVDDTAIGGNPLLLDAVDSDWCEDKNDNGADDKSKGKFESQAQPDTSVLSGDMLGLPLSFERYHTALDVDQDGLVELPIANDPNSPAAGNYVNEYTKAQVLKHTITHELGHAVGMAHTAVSTCAMYEYTINWGRDGFFSDSARAAMRIHNQ